MAGVCGMLFRRLKRLHVNSYSILKTCSNLKTDRGKAMPKCSRYHLERTHENRKDQAILRWELSALSMMLQLHLCCGSGVRQARLYTLRLMASFVLMHPTSRVSS